ncbi:LPS export ABC transporter periplasmic protein LptC [Poseidonocella sedimentorum]|uniref:Lipopolysaccharide export system protein LptC n=1 Tax=Poseidonocella sedimentorum TaxID=871652 RepID=A0A1I6D3X3_9RHOB|nr:LPS export ABC transporter periplasmic protein LptC [Poseidonocella sedimentorum]SFR00169.1 lipopolysaccharide export system protein LptC [Poseidonocella sedimentorum]
MSAASRSTGAKTVERYSRFVAWAKVILPLAALALLSTLFLLAKPNDPEKSIPYARVDIEDRIREPRVTAPLYAGVTSDGASLSVRAISATPEPGSEGTADVDRLSATIETAEGQRFELEAPSGRVQDSVTALLDGGVTVRTSDGYRMETEAIESALNKTYLATRDTVRAEGPLGRLTAGRMEVTTDAAGGGTLMVFNEGVRLIYLPQGDEEN